MDWYVLVLFLIPYAFVGNEFGNLMVLGTVSVWALLNPKPIKKRSLMVIAFLAWSCFSLTLLGRWPSGISGFACWLSIALATFAIDDMNNEQRIKLINRFKPQVMLWVEGICIVNLMGALIFKWPAKGLLGYENSFALLLALFIVGIVLDVESLKNNPQRTVRQVLVFSIALLLTRAVFTLGILLITLGILAIRKNALAKRIAWVVVVLGACFGVFILLRGNIELFFTMGIFATLIERIIVIQDLLSYWVTHPGRALIGSAFDSFQREQYSIQSAYYDLRYIHNSVFQLIYETGMIGFLMLLGFFIKRKCISPSARVLVIMGVVHSFFDFDLAFPIFIMLLIFATAPNSDQGDLTQMKKSQPALAMIGLGLSLYMIVVSSCVLAGDVLLNAGNVNAEKAYKIASRINPWVISPKEGLFDLYRGAYSATDDQTYAKESLRLLSEIETWGARQGFTEGRILLNEGIINAKLGNKALAHQQILEGIKSMPFNPNGYKVYQTYFSDEASRQSHEIRINQQRRLLNPLAGLLPNQINR